MAEKEKFNNQQYRHPSHKKLHLYKRKKSPNWSCVFYHKSKAYRITTKSKNKPDAEAFAEDWYIKKLGEIRCGFINTEKPKNLPTVKDASIIAINKYRILVDQGKRSPEYLRGIIQVMGKQILPYFGDMPVEDIDKVVWNNFKEELYTNNTKIARNSILQYRNALSLCMNSAEDKGWIKSTPKFKIESESNKDQKIRVWFKPDEQEILLQALDENVEHHKETPHRKGALELRDYVKFLLYSGLRTGEANNVKFSNIEIIEPEPEPEKIEFPKIVIQDINGKSRTGSCNAHPRLISVFKSISERVKPTNQNQNLFQHHHREMYNAILKKYNLKNTIDGRRRDFYSLRHTYICNMLIDGEPIYNVASNCRTSVDVIENHYAKFLPPDMLNIHKKQNELLEKNVGAIAKQEIELGKRKENFIKMIQQFGKDLNDSKYKNIKDEMIKKLAKELDISVEKLSTILNTE